ncbi:MAG: MarR family winged helix-turn-helix transcriptional regulator [Acidimicrobiia bacterium]
MERMSSEALELWQRWLRFHRRMLDRLDHDLRATRLLSLEQYDVLFQLSQADGPLRMGELAASTLIAPSSCTRIVGSLVSAGLVARASDPDDRRAVRVALTAAGRGAQQRAATVHLRGLAEAFAGRLDDAALTALARVLDQLEAGDPTA